MVGIFYRRAVQTVLCAMVVLGQANQSAVAATHKEELCDCSPEITMLVKVNNVRKTATLVTKAGGKVVYDPNLGVGNDIPFLVITLPPEKLIDDKFIKSLNLPSGGLQPLSPIASDPLQKPGDVDVSLESLFVPLEDINVPALRNRKEGEGLGEDTIVAVIDTGIDASHPVFQDRVIFWDDATKEGRTMLKKARVLDKKIEIAENKWVSVPPALADNTYVYFGVVSEKKLGIQDGDMELSAGKEGYDLNRNGDMTDKFLVIVGEVTIPEKKAEAKKDDDKDADKKEADDKDADEKGAEDKDADDKDAEKKDQDATAEKKADAAADAKEADQKQEVVAKDNTDAKADDDTPADKDEEKEEKAEGDDKEEKDSEKKEEKADGDDKDAKKPEAKKVWAAFFDLDGNAKLSGKELSPILSYNEARAMDKMPGEQFKHWLRFPSRTRKIQYPVLFRPNSKKAIPDFTICFDEMAHGTHVAGIVAGDGAEIKGAAPKAKLMAIKVCSGRSCTDMAILSGLVKAFYNPQGLVPDVVNISLGSQEQFVKPGTSLLIQDLSAKFGTVFFISASNSGPGYRSINGFATSSPAVYVGAHVSAKTLRQHYSLQEGVPVRDHGLLYFSSVGPSFTGEMRPNIVAPGSALSSTPLNTSGAGMFNGTSMSSPIAAGAAAALISLAKKDDQYKPVLDWQKKKIATVKAKKLENAYSLTSMALSMRAALENTAQRMDGFTMAQQGYGLIDIDAAYDEYIKLSNVGLKPETRRVEFEINGNSKATRLYDRSNAIARHRSIAVTMNIDGEVAEEERLLLQNTPVQIRLERVEVQANDGTVMDWPEDEPSPFSIARPGKEDEQGEATSIVMTNRVKSSFVSTRRVESMEIGKTYIATYNFYQHGQRLFTLLDVVHRPIELSDVAQEITLPGIGLQDARLNSSFVVQEQAIDAFHFHRYPVAVTGREHSISVTIGFAKESAGRLLVSAYDSEGNEVGYRVIRQTGQLGGDLTNAQLTIPTLKKSGVYEILVSAYSGLWPSGSTYDMLVQGHRFRPSTESVTLSSEASSSSQPKQKLITFANSARQITSATATVSGLRRFESVSVPTIANYRTFAELSIPKYREGSGEPKTTGIVLRLSPAEVARETFYGRIDHRLYRRKPDGSFTVASTGKALGGNKIFTSVTRPEVDKPFDPLFVAVDTFLNIPEDKSPKHTRKSVELHADFTSIPVRLEGAVGASVLRDGQPSVFIVKLQAPKALKDAAQPPAPAAKRGEATLQLPDGNTVKVKIPVSIDPKAPPVPKVKVKGTLNVGTNDRNTSISIPIEIQQ